MKSSVLFKFIYCLFFYNKKSNLVFFRTAFLSFVFLSFLGTNPLSITTVKADTLSEGWYKLLLGQQHIGYIVQRYELDPKKNQVILTSFLRTNTLGGDLTESLQAHSTTGFEPVSYQYSLMKGKAATLIDAKFSKEGAAVRVTENGETKTHKYKVPQGTFLSYFLGLVMTSFKNPKDASDSGIKVGRSFSYKAIAEEDGQLSDGNAEVLGTEKINGHETFRIRVKYKNIQSISFLTATAEIAQINQPISGHQIKVTSREDATRGFPSSEKSLKTLFGTIPKDSPLSILHPQATIPNEPPTPAAPTTPNLKSDAPKKLGIEPDLEVKQPGVLVPPGKGNFPDNPNE